MNVGERIANNRKKLGYSQEQLAIQMNVSRQTVSKWENNTHLPELDKCMELSRLFQISLDELLLGEQAKDTGLSEEQFKQLIQEIKPTPKKSRKWLKTCLACCLILVLGKLISDNNYLNHEINNLSDSLIYLADRINQQTSTIQTTIQEAIRSSDSIISDFKTKTIHYDIEKEEVRVKVQIYPKEMNETSQLEVKFSNDENQLVQGELVRHDNYFEKEFIFPLNNFTSVQILLKNNDTLQQMTFHPELFLLDRISLGLGNYASQGVWISPNNEEKTYTIEIGDCDIEFLKESSARSITINNEEMNSCIESIQYDVYLNQQLYATQKVLNLERQKFKIPVQDGDEIYVILHYTDTLGLHYRELVTDLKVKVVDNVIDSEPFVSPFTYPEIATK